MIGAGDGNVRHRAGRHGARAVANRTRQAGRLRLYGEPIAAGVSDRRGHRKARGSRAHGKRVGAVCQHQARAIQAADRALEGIGLIRAGHHHIGRVRRLDRAGTARDAAGLARGLPLDRHGVAGVRRQRADKPLSCLPRGHAHRRGVGREHVPGGAEPFDHWLAPEWVRRVVGWIRDSTQALGIDHQHEPRGIEPAHCPAQRVSLRRRGDAVAATASTAAATTLDEQGNQHRRARGATCVRPQSGESPHLTESRKWRRKGRLRSVRGLHQRCRGPTVRSIPTGCLASEIQQCYAAESSNRVHIFDGCGGHPAALEEKSAHCPCDGCPVFPPPV